MTDETKKQRKPSYTVSKWAEENGYTDAMLALIGDDAKKIMPAVKAKYRAQELADREERLKKDAEKAALEAARYNEEAQIIQSIKFRLDAIKKAATST